MKIYVINGPNLNMLGIREPDIYGSTTLTEVERSIREHCKNIGVLVECFQSNHEGALVDIIQDAFHKNADGIVINPAAYTHTSIAILDALKSTDLPFVEIHISNPMEREEFRQCSYIRSSAIATVLGKGVGGYVEAVDLLVDYLRGKN